MSAAAGPVVLLDRDGVLDVDPSDFLGSVDDLEVLPGTRDAVTRLVHGGYVLVVVTNQSCVGRGLVDRSAVDAINAELNRRLDGAIADWFVCPHAPDDGCACRKPGTDLLEQARVKWGFDPAVTWFVADAERDIEAARRFGCRPALVRTGKGADTEGRHPDVPAFDDLAAFAHWLLTRRAERGVRDGSSW